MLTALYALSKTLHALSGLSLNRKVPMGSDTKTSTFKLNSKKP